MTTTRSSLSHRQIAREIEIVVRDRLETPSDVSAYQVEDRNGDRFIVISELRHDPELVPNDRYRIKHALGVDYTFDERTEFADQFAAAADNECPRCESELEFDTGLTPVPDPIREFLLAKEHTGIHLEIISETAIVHLSADDDWIPFEPYESPLSLPGPSVRCSDCPFSAPGDDIERALEYVEEDRILEQSVNYSADAASETIGMATGGAKDVDNFRENIANGSLPDEDALTYEGLFYDYYFETGNEEVTHDALFYPTYSTAVTEHPLTGDREYYLSVGLNSTMAVDDFSRRCLNLVAVLDVSGSMGAHFDRYYYDDYGQQREVETDSTATKLEAACESLAALTHHLRDDDRFGVVLYNSQEHVAKPLSRVDETDMDAIRRHIREIQSSGGTNMSAGLETAIDLLGEYENTDRTMVENRIVFMTDMMPNTGATGRNTIASTVESAANRDIYTTFVGMGIDVNPDLVESLSSVRGANHYFVHSAEEFARRLDDEFEYMVTPLVFDLQLELTGDSEIAEVYGSPTADQAQGRLMHVSTLFPSPSEDGESRGGIVLLKLANDPSGDLQFSASWEEIDGRHKSSTVDIEFDGTADADSFRNTGIQKAVCLTHYCTELRTWIRTHVEQSSNDDWVPMNQPRPPRPPKPRGRWERTSTPFLVTESDRERFESLQSYLSETATEVSDETLKQGVELLQSLIDFDVPSDHELSEEALELLRDLIELAPTKNAELADTWGLETGSEVHHHLESHLEGLYYRDNEWLIRPTEEALELVSTL